MLDHPPLRGGDGRAARRRPYPSAATQARERRHRRLLLIGIALLLLLSVTPVVGQHLFFAAHQPLTGVDHIGALCLVALHVLLEPVHEGLHLLLVGGVLYALVDRGRAWWRARGVLAALRNASPASSDALGRAARAADVPLAVVRIVDGLPTPAFTAGWWRPRVYVARALVEGPRRLDGDELTAVLAHEHAHVRGRDPLRFSALRAMASALFWLPALRRLADDVADEAEIGADDAAAAVTDPLVVAGAIMSLAGWSALGAPGPTAPHAGVPPGAVGFVRADLLDRRVRRLAGERTEPVSRVTRGSLAAAALALTLAWVAGIVHVHPLPHVADPMTVQTRHCEHPDASALRHLLCRAGFTGGWFTPGGEDCPHSNRDVAPAAI